MEAIEDLPTLHYLLQASSISASIFARFYSDVVTAIVANYPPALQRLLRLSLYLQNADEVVTEGHTNTEATLDQLLNTFLTDEIQDVAADLSLKSPLALAAATSHAHTAQNVQQLAHQILEALLARTEQIIPSYQLDPNYQYRFESQRKLPECRPYAPVTWSTPSWIEEQRVLRALWRIQVYTQLRGIVMRRQNPNSWNPVDTVLKIQGPERICRNAGRWDGRWELDELDWVYNFLLRDATPETTTATDMGQYRHLSLMPRAKQQQVAMPALYPKHDANLYCWDQAELHLGSESTGASFIRTLSIGRSSRQYGDDFDRFWQEDLGLWPLSRLWQLGLGMWDGKRMAMLGLLRGPSEVDGVRMSESEKDGLKRAVNTGWLSTDELFTRWRSVWLQAPAIISKELQTA
ncbi:MAG: hypothetical protein LQ346_008034 [Caloplaca aetnensis]|nr:MAG: hypothetical protein LQ346_008034 [Caloplaca aetnensis]